MKTPLDRGLFKRRAQNTGMNRGLRGGMASRIIGPWEWVILPALLSMLLTIILGTPVQVFGWHLPEPVSPLILAFVWPLIRPSYSAPIALTGLGLFLDAYWSAPLGFYTFGLMLVYGVLLTIRTYVAGQDWRIVFGIFMVAQIVFFSFGIIMLALDTGSVVNLFSVFSQIFGTTLLFPFIPYLLDKYVHADVRFS